MKKFAQWTGAAALGVALLATPMAVGAQGKAKTNKSAAMAKDTAGSSAASQTTLAYQLAGWARANGDAMAMSTAASLLAGVTVKEGDAGKFTAKGVQSKDTGAAKTASSADLFAEAKALAKGDQDTLGAIDAAQAKASKGVVGGAIARTRWVPGNTDWSLTFNARGGEPLIIGARVGALPVGLQLVDEGGHVVCQDTSGDDVIGCKITPAWTGAFTAHFVNVGNYGGAVTVVSN